VGAPGQARRAEFLMAASALFVVLTVAAMLAYPGGAKYDQLSSHKIKWTDPTVKAALKVMAQVVGDVGNIPGGKSGALQTDFNTSVSNVFSDTPKAAISTPPSASNPSVRADIQPHLLPSLIASSRPASPVDISAAPSQLILPGVLIGDSGTKKWASSVAPMIATSGIQNSQW